MRLNMIKEIVLSAVILIFGIIFIIKNLKNHRIGKLRQHRHVVRHQHGSLVLIDYYAYSSKIRHWNPAFKVIFSVLTIILCITLNNVYVSAAVILASVYIVVAAGGLELHNYLSVMSIPLAFILISVIAVAVDFSVHMADGYSICIGFGYLYTTADMLKTGIFLMLKIIAAVSGLQMMVLTTPSSEIISVMKKMHIPGIFIELMYMIYRYIFILLDVYAKMKNAAESRLGYRDFKTSCYTFGGTAGNLLVLSLKKAGAYYEAMEARCYDGDLAFLEEDKKLDFKLVAGAALYFLFLLLIWYLTE